VCLEVNPEKTKYMVVSHCQNTGLYHNLLTPYKSFENVAQFKYLGMTVTNENCIHEEIKCRLNLGDACYLSVHNHFSSCLLSKDLETQIHKIIILHLVFYGCENWSLSH